MAVGNVHGDVWIHLFDDPTTYLRFDARGTEEETLEKPGDVRGYANGRRRLVVRAGQVEGLQLTLNEVTRDQWETLRSWAGEVIMVRDPVGRLFFGTFLSPQATEQYPRDVVSVALLVEALTVSLAV